MSVELQKVKRSSHLAEWSEMVRACKNSGLTVRAWCAEQGLNEKTYYHRQKQVCNALAGEMCCPAQFAEVSPATIAASAGAGIPIRIGAAEIRVDGNTDLALLRDILRAVAGIC